MSETDYETLLNKLASGVGERNASSLTILACIAAEYIRRTAWADNVPNRNTTISQVAQAVEAYSNHNRDKRSRSYEVYFDELIYVVFLIFRSDEAAKREREHWIQTTQLGRVS